MAAGQDEASADEPTKVERESTTPSARSISSVASESTSRGSLPDWLKDQVKHSFGAKLGRYALLRVLGEGGMGVVFAAYDEELDRKVAIKLLRTPAQGAGWDKSWLLNEAKAMARLSHPNIVQVYDVGEEEQQLFVAMEFLVGVSLKDWLKAKKRSWREVVEVSAQAGRGLQAAHEAGLVHCDYKPQNVLVGKDGRVRVLDFGLAQLHGRTHAARSGRADEATRTTVLGGTPAYMAPELYLHGEPDARSDQFAFCVALFEGLFGKRPFRGKGYEELGKAIVSGDMQAPPPEAKVPAHLRKAVLRGLSREPKDRWPSMEALLAELARDPARTARRWAIGAGVTLLVGLSALNFVQKRALEAELEAHRCDAAAGVGEGWGGAGKEAVRAAITASGLAYADDTWARVEARVDRYVADWSAMRVEACEANRGGAQSDLLYDRRVACLEQRRTELAALVDVLAAADKDVVTKAVKATSDLRPLSVCADAEALLAAVAPPETPEAVAEVERARKELAAVRAEMLAGRFKPAKERLQPTLTVSEALGYRPLRAEALLLAGLVEDALGDYKVAAARLEDAVWSAEGSRHDAIAAEAAIRMSFVTGFRLTQFDLSALWERHVDAIFERRGGPREHASRWLATQGVIASRKGDGARALELMEQALPASEGPTSLASSYEAATLLVNLGSIAGMLGRHEQAYAYLEKAAVRMVDLVGPMHPDVAVVYGNLGSAAAALANFAGAREYMMRSLSVYERGIGLEHPEVARLYNNIGSIYSREGSSEAALQWYEKAYALRRKLLGDSHTDTANAAANLGDVYLKLGQPAKAIEYLKLALVGHEASVGEAHPRYGAALAILGLAELTLGRAKAAIASIERALAVMTAASSAPHEQIGEARLGLARALWPDRKSRARALKEARAAIEDLTAAGPSYKPELAEAQAWLRERGG